MDLVPRGLSRAEAAARLRAEGPNELARDRPRGFLTTAATVLREPMLLLLVAAGAVYVLLGDHQEAVILLAAVVVVIAITLVQSHKTERALAALRDLASPRALVVRGGERSRIAGREVVRGDLLVLAEGDRVAADAVVVETSHLETDESLLTGESAPVRKRAGDPAEAAGRPGGDGSPSVWAGSLVVRGAALAVVRATGSRSEMGRIGAALAALDPGSTPLQVEVRRMVRVVGGAGLVVCVAVVALHGLLHARWMEGLLAGIATAMSMLPEEFPVVLTIFMAMGAWRISRSRVLTRRMPAIEALGAATVLCTDKTGTLTENRMRVARLWAAGTEHVMGEGPLPEVVHPVLEHAILASERDPFDPMERALHRLGEEALAGSGHLHAGWVLEREYPLSVDLLAMTQVWRPPGGGPRVVAAKGAPEAIATVCRLGPAAAAELHRRTAALGASGLRVLAVARAAGEPGALPGSQRAFAFELLGGVAFEDPLRPGVPAAVAECEAAGVRVVMVTGDAPGTARAMAAKAGLPPGDVVTGPELDALDDAAFAARAGRARVFARTVPEQKLRLVQALRARGEVVAMTGDGVNDAPALKAAHIGVAMGGRGTDVAREAAALIVTDDDFTSIVGAIRLGRRVHDNLRRAMAYVVSVHVPVAGLALLPLLVGWPLVLFPLHIVFLELVIDPACSLAFEAEPADPGVMRRPPRRLGEPLFGGTLLTTAVLQGASVLAASLVALWLGRGHGGDDVARTLAFTALITGNLGLILVNRSWSRATLASFGTRNLASWVVVAGAAAALATCLAVPALRALLRFGTPHPADLAAAAAGGLLAFGWFEVVKLLRPGWLREGAA